MIDFQNIEKNFGECLVLRDASFRVNPGERVGVTGPNGAGKSTIFKLVTGELTPDSGTVSVPKDMRIGHMRQQLNPHTETTSLLAYTENTLGELKTVEEEMLRLEHALADRTQASDDATLHRLGDLHTRFDQLGGYRLRHRTEAVLSGFGFAEEEFEKPFAAFSGGWQMRAELARVLVGEPDILLLDEPTNYLDSETVEWLQGFMRDFSGILLLISHDRFLLNRLTNVTLEVFAGYVTRYAGAYDTYIKARRERHEQLSAAKKKQDREREKIERFVERFRAKNTKASQVQSRLKQLEKMEEIPLPDEVIHPPAIRLPKARRSGAEVVRMENVGMSYDGSNWVLRGVELTVNRGEKLALVGVNGMGKTTLLRILSGKLEPSEGRCALGHNVELGYFAQEFTETMNPRATVYETARRAAVGISDGEVRKTLGAFRFPYEETDKPVEVLSGGEKSRLALLRLLVNPANLIVLDEPTSHLDIGSREVLEKALREYDGTLLVVSHDIEFIRNVADGVLCLDRRGLTRYFGGYDYYAEKRRAELAALDGSDSGGSGNSVASGKKGERQRRAADRRRIAQKTKPLKKRMREIEAQLDACHAERDKLTESFHTASETVDFPAVNRRLAELAVDVAALEEEWEAVALELEELDE
jgi:ATP-binding cassette subfamily F protein 3